MGKGWVFIGLFFISWFGYSQVNHWESAILEGDEFRYLIPTSQPSSTWIEVGFNDASWGLGDSGFGYGDEDDNTEITNPSITVYLRKSFTVVDIDAIDDLLLHMDYDDGFVAYLNGIEIGRDLVSGNPPAFNQPADDLHEALLYLDLVPEKFSVDPNLLVQGENILAVEVHNESTTSSDMTAIPILSLGINNESFDYNPTPSWFVAPIDFTSSTLPLILIETESEILDEPKISASMKIISRIDGQPNSLDDRNNPVQLDFDGQIQIELRGSSSQALPKKPYGFTTYDNDGIEKSNVSLLGMPKENDWILNSLAFDPSLIRDYITYNLARELGEYATRTQFCEVFVNNEYKGLYVLQEKMKADDDRIDINKIEVEDNSLPHLTGGYITKADKTTGGDPVAWNMGADFIHSVPKPEEATSQQTAYIKSVFENLASQAENNNSSLTSGYPSIIDIPSFIDFIVLNELSSNADAYQFSTYFHKDRNGKLRAGPIWDINLSYGNDLFEFGFDRSFTDVWQLEFLNVGAPFWRDLFYADDFNCHLSKRWNELTQIGQPLHPNELGNMVDETVALIAGSIAREEATWGRVGDHDAEIVNMKAWIVERVNWMNARLGAFAECSNPSLPSLVISKIHYHPSSEEFEDSDLEFIEITNAGAESIDLTGIYFGGTGLVYQFPVGATIAADQRIMLANDKAVYQEAYENIPFGEFSRSLSNSGQIISLRDGFGNLIDVVSYSDVSPWPEEADGNGFYLELIDVNSDNSLAENWSAISLLQQPLSSSNLSLQVSIYPNPSIRHIQIKSGSLIREIKVIDGMGKILEIQAPNSQEYMYDAGKLKVGIYFLFIKTDQGIEQRKIAIRR